LDEKHFPVVNVMIVGILDFIRMPFVVNLEYYRKRNKEPTIHIVMKPRKKNHGHLEYRSRLHTRNEEKTSSGPRLLNKNKIN
jgi:hypothetical protein